MKAVKVTTDNKVTILDCPEGIPLDWLRKEIGCEWIEIVRPLGLPRGYVMIIDEEGKLKPNAMNMVGSFLYQTHKHGDEIMGNFVLVKEGSRRSQPLSWNHLLWKWSKRFLMGKWSCLTARHSSLSTSKRSWTGRCGLG